ncbi:IclR family transcriptional regulator [Zwartia vadi]|uniref:IclR family transcriptional regulator n=1 Tax=Zwartia vadi TaxID=3058168 RepID=UPI0025B53990|nr:IclR family transcriptional regulator [Zwartia vadi]MDN3988865.1 IclR family transcriptional regulator [Zwartia vadi]
MFLINTDHQEISFPQLKSYKKTMPQSLPTAERTLQVFEIYAKEKRPLSNSEMARLLGVADSSCSDLLHTLRLAGYLLRAPKTRLFHPTGRLFDIAQQINAADPLQTFAAEALEILCRKSGESAMCGVLDGNNARVIAYQESPRALRYVLKPGTRIELHTTALGKALLGTLDDKSREMVLASLKMDPITIKSIQNKEELRSQLEKGRIDGYYSNFGEGNEAVGAVGIAGHVGGQLVAISIVGPLNRMEKNSSQNIDVLLNAKKEFFER